MFARNLGLSLLCHVGAIGVASWWWQAAVGPPVLALAPQEAEVEPVWELEAVADSPVVVPLADCISAAREANQQSLCPSPCTPCPACPEAGESPPSLTVQFGLGLFGLLLVEAAKLCFAVARRLGGQLQRVIRSADSPEETGGGAAFHALLPTPVREPSPAPFDLEEFAREQARASRLRRIQQQ